MRRAIELALGPLLLAFAAVQLGSLAAFAIAIGLGLTYVGLHLAVGRAAERIVVARRLDHHEILEGSPLTLQVEIGGIGGLPVGVEMLCQCGRWHALALGVNRIAWAIDRPGPHVVGPSPLRIKDDLGLFTRHVSVGERDEVLVLPEPAAVPAGPRRGVLDVAHDPEPDGLRTYVPGTPVSRIHWKSAARGGEVQERKFAPSADHLPLVLVDADPSSGASAVDWTARTAAGHVLTLARGGGCRVLLPGDRAPILLRDPVSHWPAVHRRIADLRPGRPDARVAPAELAAAVRVSATSAPAADPTAAPARPLPPGVVRTGAWEAA